MTRGYRDLLVWQKAMDLVVAVYGLTRHFPKYELYGLSNQLQRAAVSVPSNIAEGSEKQHPREFLQALHVSSGSLAEVETQVEIARRLDYISTEQADSIFGQSAEIGRMLNGLCKKQREKIHALKP